MTDVRFPVGTARPRPLAYALVPGVLLGGLGVALFPLSAVLTAATVVLLPATAAMSLRRRVGGRPC